MMSTVSRLAATLLIGMACSAEAAEAKTPADGRGSPAAGLEYARKTCARCHAVGSGQRLSPDPRARSFAAIASTPGMTATALNVWLHTSHPRMPNLIIDPKNIDDLSAYISTLKTEAR